jgi:hypothetical protein
MEYIKLFEQWKNTPGDSGSSGKSHNKTTVAEVMNWYAGDDWDKGWQTTNTMTVHDPNGKLGHAQDDGEDGMSHLRDLKAAENEEIVVICQDGGNAWDCSFTLVSNGKTYMFQASEEFGSDIPTDDLMLVFSDPEKAPLPQRDDTSGKFSGGSAHDLVYSLIRGVKGQTLGGEQVCNFVKYLRRVNSPEFSNFAISKLFKEHTYLRQDEQAIRCLSDLANSM